MFREVFWRGVSGEGFGRVFFFGLRCLGCLGVFCVFRVFRVCLGCLGCSV